MQNTLSNSIQSDVPAINLLPVEILGIIFTWLLPPHPRIYVTCTDSADYRHLGVSCVCRHWRQVVLSMPTFWTDIYAGKRLLRATPNLHMLFIALQVLRSGSCPLSVVATDIAELEQLDYVDSTPRTFAQMLVDNIHRIQSLEIQTQSLADVTFLRTRHAAQLETLVIRYNCDRPLAYGPPLTGMQMPRLQTLMISNYPTYPTGPFNRLRHLILRAEKNHSVLSDAKGLFALLSANAGWLEDLVIDDWSPELDNNDRLLAPAGKLLSGEEFPIHMTALKHLCAKVPSKIVQLLEAAFVMPNCARSYFCSRYGPLAVVADSNAFPISHLCIRDRVIMATNGRAALRVTCHTSQQSSLPMSFAKRGARELWICFRSRRREPVGLDFAKAIFNEMVGVEKLVIENYVPWWLEVIAKYNAFPALNELQLHFQAHGSNPQPSYILKFLEDRKQDGRAINSITLRFPHHIWCFPSELAPFESAIDHFRAVVEHVVYEYVPRHSEMPQMELPSVCFTRSSVHAFWVSWNIPDPEK